MELQDRKGRSISDLSQAADRFTREAQGQKQVTNIYDSFRADVPQVSIDIDRNHAGRGTLQAWGKDKRTARRWTADRTVL